MTVKNKIYLLARLSFNDKVVMYLNSKRNVPFFSQDMG